MNQSNTSTRYTGKVKDSSFQRLYRTMHLRYVQGRQSRKNLLLLSLVYAAVMVTLGIIIL